MYYSAILASPSPHPRHPLLPSTQAMTDVAAQVASLTSRLEALESDALHIASFSAVRKYQIETLLKLREMRAALQSAPQAADRGEIEALKKENEELKYRVEILKNALEEEEKSTYGSEGHEGR